MSSGVKEKSVLQLNLSDGSPAEAPAARDGDAEAGLNDWLMRLAKGVSSAPGWARPIQRNLD